MQHFKSQKSALAGLCFAEQSVVRCLVCQELHWPFAVPNAEVPPLRHWYAVPHSPRSRSAPCPSTILPTDKCHLKHPKLLPCSFLHLGVHRHCPVMSHPCGDLRCCWALLVPVPRVAMCSALWGPSFWSLDTFFPRAVVKLFRDPPLSEPQSHPNLLGLSYWDVSQNSRSQLRERILLLIPQKLNLCLKPHMVQ